ncbi:MAG: 2OG-Fe(II) oxygenase [Gammaproteobacteria bacterium]|nr:2OG-Fe(II) oxygenase [Gammaproteobacteria bacterium]
MQNFIVEFKNALAPEYCDQLIEKFTRDPAKTAGKTGAGVDKSKKDSMDLYISTLPNWQQECQQISQLILQAVTQYAKAYPFLLTGAVSPSIQDPKTGQVRTITHQDIQQMGDADVSNLIQSIYRLDDVNMQYYQKAKGGYHHWHSEHFPHPVDQGQRSLHRVLLWLIYLNDVEQGGETEFYFQQAKVKASKGSLVLAPCGFTHTHRGCVPESSDKYVLASWLMYKDAKTLYGQG